MTEHGLRIYVEHPGPTNGSGDRVTVTYVLDGPERGPTAGSSLDDVAAKIAAAAAAAAALDDC